MYGRTFFSVINTSLHRILAPTPLLFPWYCVLEQLFQQFLDLFIETVHYFKKGFLLLKPVITSRCGLFLTIIVIMQI